LNHEINTDESVVVGIQELRLRPGTEMKIQDSKDRTLSHDAQFVAVFPGKSILIALLVDNTRNIELQDGDNYLFKGFNGKYDFSFTSRVLQVEAAQFNARISCPVSVVVKFVRGYLRAVLNLPARYSAEGRNSLTPVVIKDLSAGGAGIDSSEPLGNIGDKIYLSLQIKFEKKNVDLNLASIIKHVTQSDSGLRTGVEFGNPSQTDKLMLHYYVNTLSEFAGIN